MDLWSLALPTPFALATVVLIGYIAGRRRWLTELRRFALGGTRELQQTRGIIRELEGISQQVRRNLASHQSSILNFRERISELSQQEDRAAWDRLSDEADRILKPTLDLSEQIAHAYDEIRQRANLLTSFSEVRTDPLTGLGNRRAMEEMVHRMFATKARSRTTFSLAIVDIDPLKEINEPHGGRQADHTLCEFARKLEGTARETDFVTRYGSEEFVVLMPETDLQGASVFCERLRGKADRDLNLTVSCGVAAAMEGDTLHSLLSRADTALYSAKADGRNSSFQHTGHQIERIAPRSAIRSMGGSGAGKARPHARAR